MDRLVEYIQVNHWLVLATVVVLVLVIVFEFRAHAESFAAVSPQDAIRLMNRGAVVIDLRGGLAAWRADNLPLEKGSKGNG